MSSKTAQNALRKALVSQGLKYKGVTENPPGSNRVQFWTKTANWQGSPWCGAYVTTVVLEVTGVQLWKKFNSFYTPEIVQVAKKKGAWKTGSPYAGDWSLMNFPGGNFVDHVGMVISGMKNIEGNTSAGNSGSQSNGGGVFVRTRSSSVTAGWVDIVKLLEAYGFDIDAWYKKTGGKTTTKTAPKKLALLAVDGEPGPATYTALQAFLNKTRKASQRALVVDGEWGPATIKQLQWKIGAVQDGEWGPETQRKFVIWLGLDPKKASSAAMWRALQTKLNVEIKAGRL